MYNLIEYSKNYRKTTGSLFNYYRDEENSGMRDDDDTDNINYSIKDSRSFIYKTSITGKLINNNEEKDVKIVMSLKYLGKFWRNLDILLINFEISLTLYWYENYVLTSIATRTAPRINNPTNAHFKITDCKLYVPVVTLSSSEDNKLLDQLKSGFKRTIKWNKYMSQMANQTDNNNLNYLIDPTF